MVELERCDPLSGCSAIDANVDVFLFEEYVSVGGFQGESNV